MRGAFRSARSVPGVEHVRARLPDPFTIPKVKDSYSALFQMDYRDQYIAGVDAADRNNYPYLGWACDHFHGAKKSPLRACDYQRFVEGFFGFI
jgi:hypothetical protein